jgi:geranylgeranyl reductase family protein
MPNSKHKSYDVAIIGAGPAGCAAALGLGQSGLRVALIDKAEFPRGKTCGDAIPGPAIKALKNAFPFFEKEFLKLEKRQQITSSRIMLKKGRSVDFQWSLPAYNIKRGIFDAFLFSLIKKYTNIDILTGWPVDKIMPGKTHMIKSGQADQSLQAKMIIASDGANSVVEKCLQHQAASAQSQVFAVRAYFKGVNLNTTTNFFWVDKKYLPGYFWAFPLPDGEYNVGFGMKIGREGKASLDMKGVLEEFVRSEKMSHIFSQSRQLTDTGGAFIPIGGKRLSYSGDGYLLAGDAAHLADPLQGHGIDKAVVSGLLAAHHTMNCFKENDFSEAFNISYYMMIRLGIEKELRKNRQRQLILSNFPSLLSLYSYFK